MTNFNSKQNNIEDGCLVYLDNKHPNVTLKVKLPDQWATLNDPLKIRARSLANYLAREVFANQPKSLPSNIKVAIPAEILNIDPYNKHAAEIDSKVSNSNEYDSKEWMAAQCRSILSKMSENSQPTPQVAISPDIYDKNIMMLMQQVAHLHGDLFIEATELEGFDQIKMMSLALAILEKQRTTLLTLPNDLYTNQTIKELTLLINRITSGLSTHLDTNIHDRIPKIQKLLNDLKPGEGTLLPGGWAGIPQAHSMCYEIIKQEDKTFTMRVFNTGEGNQNHKSIETFDLDAPGRKPKLSKKFFPYIEIRHIHPEKMMSEHFWKAALEIRTHVSFPSSSNPGESLLTQYDASDLYDKLFSVLGGKKTEPSSAHKDKYILPQSSGICSWASLRAYIQTHLSPKAFARLEYEYKMDSLCILHQTLNPIEKFARFERGILLLLKSSQHFANSLQENYENSVITPEEYKKATETIDNMQMDIAECTFFLKQKLANELKGFDLYPVIYQFDSYYRATSNINTEFMEKISSDKVQKKPCQLVWDKNWKPALATIGKDFTSFLALYSKNLDSFPETIALHIREILLSLPKYYDPFWEQITADKIESCIGSIASLCELLMLASQKHSISPLELTGASFLIALYKSQTILHELIKRIPELKKMGCDKWPLNAFDLKPIKEIHKFNPIVTMAFQDLLNAEGQYGGEKFFPNICLEHPKAIQGKNNIPQTDAEFAYIYYMAHQDEFAKTLGPEFDKLILGVKSSTPVNLPIARATFSMADLSGKFLPPSYSSIKRLQAQIDMFKNFCKIPKDSNFLIVKILNHLLYISVEQDKILEPSSPHDYTIEKSYFHKICSGEFENPSNEDSSTSIEQSSELKHLLSICQAAHTIAETTPNEIKLFKLIDYFKTHIDSLSDHDLQCFFRQVLFKQNDLKDLLRKSPEFAARLVIFIQDGFSFFQEQKKISGAAFMVYLAQMIVEAFDALKWIPQIQNAIEQLNKHGIDTSNHSNGKECLINLLKECKTLTEKSLVHRQLLYHYSLEINTNKNVSEILPDIIASMAFLQSCPVPKDYRNSHIMDQIDRLRIVELPQYLTQLDKDPHLLSKSVHKALSLLAPKEGQSISWGKLTWKMASPIYEGNVDGKLTVAFNCSNFTVFSAEGCFGTLPLSVTNHPFFLTAMPSMDTELVTIKRLGVYEFLDSKECMIRITDEAIKDVLTIQKQFVKNGIWYEFKSNEVFADMLHSKIFIEKKTHWVACSGNFEVLMCNIKSLEATHAIRRDPRDDQSIEVIDLKKPNLRLLSGDSISYKQLQNFEYLKYMHIWFVHKTHEVSRIEMPRLSLNFNRKIQDKSNPQQTLSLLMAVDPFLNANQRLDPPTWLFECAEISGYWIADTQHVPFLKDFKNYLVLQNDKGNFKAVIPRKRAIITVTGGLTSQNSPAENFPDSNDSLPPYYEYEVTQTGGLKALKAGGCLYLAYILICQRRYDEAQTYLRMQSDQLKKIIVREGEIFIWIQELAEKLKDNDPKACAIFLTAIAIYVKNLLTHRINQKLGNKYYYLNYTPRYYRQYLSMMNHVGNLVLTPEEESIILKVLKGIQPDSPLLKRQLHLSSLETAFQDNKVMQDLSPSTAIPKFNQSQIGLQTTEDLSSSSDVQETNNIIDTEDCPPYPHSSVNAVHYYLENLQLVKAPTITSDSGLKDGVNLSSTTVSRLITRPNSSSKNLNLNSEQILFSYNFRQEYEHAKATKPGDNLNAALRFELLKVFDFIENSFFNIFLAAVALAPEKFPTWDGLVLIFTNTINTSPQNTQENEKSEKSTDPLNLTPSRELAIAKWRGLFAEAKRIYQEAFPVSSIDEDFQKTEGDRKIDIAANQKMQERSKTAFASPQDQKEHSDSLVLSDMLDVEKATVKRIQISQRIHNHLFTEFQHINKESASTQRSESFIKELSQKENASDDPMKPAVLLERARKNMVADIRIYTAQPAKPLYKFKEDNLKTIQASITKHILILNAEHKALDIAAIRQKDQILAILNKTTISVKPSLEAMEKNLKYKSDLLSTQKQPLTIDDLTRALLRDNPAELSEQNPHLSKDDLEALTIMLKSYLIKKTELNSFLRQREALLNVMKYLAPMIGINNAIQSAELNELINKAVQELSVKREYKLNDPKINSLAYLIFESISGKSLRTDQIDNLSGLIQTDFEIRQMIMGSGKSKILLPLLALLKADGFHIPLIIIPEPLFESTTNDLKNSLGEIFNKSIRAKSFDRNTEFTVKKLQDDYDDLLEIIRKRECLMMTPKSVACLGLKLNEALVLYAEKPDTPELREKIQLLQKILNVLKKQGRAILDEADLILKSSLEVNFTAGDHLPLDQERCHTVEMIYEQLVKSELHSEIGFNPLEEFNLSPEAYRKSTQPILLKYILNAASKNLQSLLGNYLKGLQPADHATIIKYLEGNASPEIEAFIEKSPLRDTLALLKEELNALLPLTLSKQYCVDYGPSQKKVKKGKQLSPLAIPYNGNNSPVETSEFQSPDVLMNYTMQTLWRTGIDANEVKRMMQNLSTQANREMAISRSKDPTKTAAYREFRNLCGKELTTIKFQTVEDADFAAIAQRINSTRKTDPAFLIRYVSTHVFSQIKLYTQQLTSDAINLVSMFKSVIGFTGTPWNADTYNELIRKKIETTPGTAGKTSMLLHEQTQKAREGIRTITTKTFPHILQELIRKEDDAIIDTGALFSGHSHEEVAHKILDLLHSRGSYKTGIVFFKNNQAMVLEGAEKNGVTRCVPLGLCTLKPEQRFTYYDQAHATGTDIQQPLMAAATLTIGKNTTERDLAQGAWRLRGLDRTHTISFALSMDTAAKVRFTCNLGPTEKINFAHLLIFTSQNQVEELVPQLKTSLKQKFRNIIKQAVLNKILSFEFSAKNSEEAKKLSIEVRHLLVSEFQSSPFSLYGKQEKILPAIDVMQHLVKCEIKKLELMPSDSLLFHPMTKEAFIEKIKTEMNAVMGNLSLLPKKITSPASIDTTAEKEQENEVEITVQNQKHSKNQRSTTPWWSIPVSEIPENYFNHAPHLLSACTYAEVSPLALSAPARNIFNVNARLQQHFKAKRFAPLFEKGLNITENADAAYGKSYEGSSKYVLYVREKSTNKMKLIFLDPIEDVSFFWEALGRERNKNYHLHGKPEVDLCLSNLDGDIIQHNNAVNGYDLQDPFMKAYKTQGTVLRAQAKLACGELFYTKEEVVEIQQIIKEHGQKLVLDYFKEQILPYSPEKQSLFKTSQIYQFLSQ